MIGGLADMSVQEHRVTREAASGMSLSTDVHHRVIAPRLYELRLELGDLGEACNYELEIRDKLFHGSLSATAKLVILLGDRPDGEAELRIWPQRFSTLQEAGEYGLIWSLDLVDHPSVETTKGLQNRLSNLGYCPGHIDGDHGPMTESAAQAFAHDLGLDDPSAIPDRLRRAYGI